MAGSTRIKGRKLKLEIDAVDHWADIISCVFDNEPAEADTTTFEDASQEGGALQHFATISAIQSTDTASFWRTVWDNTGTEVAYTYAPHGNETPTTDQPHFVGMLTISNPPPIGGEAGRDNTYTFERRFDLSGKPTMDTGGV